MRRRMLVSVVVLATVTAAAACSSGGGNATTAATGAPASSTASGGRDGMPSPSRDQTGGLGGLSKTGSTVKATKKTEAPRGQSDTANTPADGEVIEQWASGAEATSNYGPNPGDPWNATQATGAPDVDPNCGDVPQAWASKDKDTVENLILRYDTPVIPTKLRIFQTYNPGQVTKVELQGPSGESEIVVDREPQVADGCPVEGFVENLEVDFPVDTVVITIDQSKLGVGWAEIDAVGLVGTPAT